MNYNTATLSNGLRVIHLPNTSKIVYCGYQIKAGTRNEKAGEEGLAHFCEHISFKGTDRHNSYAIINCLESVGGDLNAFTNKEDTVFYSAIPRQHFMRAVDLLTDIVFHSTYPQTEIDKEVEVICDEIESYNDSPAELIYDEFENILFRGHPLGHNILGTAERVRSFTTEDAKRFTQTFYRPDNAIFFVYGDIDFKKLTRYLEKELNVESLKFNDDGLKFNDDGLKFNDKSLKIKDDSLKFNEERHIALNSKLSSLNSNNSNNSKLSSLNSTSPIVLHHNTHQAHVMIGNRAYPASHKLRIPLYLLNNIIGGPGMNARLNLILRERRGLVYSVESSMVSYGDTGLWCVYFGCDHDDVKRCIRLVKNELQRYADKPISLRTLNAAKRQIKGQLAVACDNNENFAIDFGKSFLHFGNEKDLSKLYADIDAVTPEQIQEASREIFDKETLTTLMIL